MQFGGELLLFAFLGSCAVAPLASLIPEETHWVLEAKIGYSDDQRKKSALLRWQQDDQDYEVHISGAIAGELAWLKKSQGKYKMRVRDQSYSALDGIEDLLEEVTEMRIPIDSFQYWIRAKPAPGSSFQEKLDNKGRRIYLEQNFWTLHYSDYQGALPLHIIAERPPYRIRMVIITWHRLGHEQEPPEHIIAKQPLS